MDTRRASSRADERRRGSVLLQAHARRLGQSDSTTLRIRNFSATGLGGNLVPGMIQGEALIVTLRGIGEISGRVARIAGSRFGFSFDHPIDPALIRNEPASPSTADRFVPVPLSDYRRPGLKPRR